MSPLSVTLKLSVYLYFCGSESFPTFTVHERLLKDYSVNTSIRNMTCSIKTTFVGDDLLTLLSNVLLTSWQLLANSEWPQNGCIALAGGAASDSFA